MQEKMRDLPQARRKASNYIFTMAGTLYEDRAARKVLREVRLSSRTSTAR